MDKYGNGGSNIDATESVIWYNCAPVPETLPNSPTAYQQRSRQISNLFKVCNVLIETLFKKNRLLVKKLWTSILIALK